MQFVQQFHAHDFTVRPLGAQLGGPVQAVGLEQDASAIHIVRVERRAHAQVGHARQRGCAQPVHQHGKDAAGGRFPVGKTQVQRAKPVACAGRSGP